MHAVKERDSGRKVCEVCGKNIEAEWRTSRRHIRLYPLRFCGESCARKYSTINDDSSETKQTLCVDCGKLIEVNKRTSPNKAVCKNCLQQRQLLRKQQKLKEKNKSCPVCGKDFCKNTLCTSIWKKRFTLMKYFGLSQKVLGSQSALDQYETIVKQLKKEYEQDGLSSPVLAAKYNYTIVSNFADFIEGLGVERRSLSEALSLAVEKGRATPPTNLNTLYKQGWHTTWNGRKVFYRSSYEKAFCDELDFKKIDYIMENPKILYKDSQKDKYRTAFPDFYLPDTNEIIEVKSMYTLDVQNMKDRVKSYKEKGYKFRLLLEHDFVDLDDL